MEGKVVQLQNRFSWLEAGVTGEKDSLWGSEVSLADKIRNATAFVVL